MQGHSGANLVPVIASNRCLICRKQGCTLELTLCISWRNPLRLSIDGCAHCLDRCGTETFPKRAEKTASSIKFHGGSFITGYTGDIIQQVRQRSQHVHLIYMVSLHSTSFDAASVSNCRICSRTYRGRDLVLAQRMSPWSLPI